MKKKKVVIEDHDQQNLVRNSIISQLLRCESDIEEIERTGTLKRLPGIKEDIELFKHWKKEYEDVLYVINKCMGIVK